MIYSPILSTFLSYNHFTKVRWNMKTINDVVVERLYKYMNERNLTQYKLAQISGIPFPTIKSIMQRRTKGITLKTIIMLADGLNITPSEFIDDPTFLAKNLNLD